jgi:hypothetical protein
MTRFGGKSLTFLLCSQMLTIQNPLGSPYSPMNDLPGRTPEEAKAPQPVEPPLDARELDKRVIDGPFAPEGECPWCDWRRGWVRRQPKPKRAVQRKKRGRSGTAEQSSAAA